MILSLIFLNLLLQIFYVPLALIVPPSIFFIHFQFSLLYQFWIHTEIVRSLGPLEYIFNTPSHHRVHHGKKNNYCVHTFLRPTSNILAFCFFIIVMKLFVLLAIQTAQSGSEVCGIIMCLQVLFKDLYN